MQFFSIHYAPQPHHLIKALVDGGAPTSMIKYVLDNSENVTTKMASVLSFSNELFPIAFEKMQMDSNKNFFRCFPTATRQNADLLVSKMDQQLISTWNLSYNCHMLCCHCTEATK